MPYFRDIFRKKTQPHVYTWAIWALLQSVGAADLFKGGAGYGTIAFVVGSIFCITIFLLSLRFGTKNINKFDLYCLIGAFLAFLAYLFINDPIYSIILVAGIDTVGYFPTFRKTFQEPYSETLSFYALAVLTNILGTFAIQDYSVTTVLYNVTLFASNGILCLIIIFRRRVVKV
jgi:hypothetical protein